MNVQVTLNEVDSNCYAIGCNSRHDRSDCRNQVFIKVFKYMGPLNPSRTDLNIQKYFDSDFKNSKL